MTTGLTECRKSFLVSGWEMFGLHIRILKQKLLKKLNISKKNQDKKFINVYSTSTVHTCVVKTNISKNRTKN